MDMTMDTSRDSKSQSAPKRSFDVAFLTGAPDKDKQQPATNAAAAASPSSESKVPATATPDDDDDDTHSTNKSAFKKVGKHSSSGGSNSSSSGSSGSASGSHNVLSDALGPSCYPFSFPAIATTLSLQLLQQNSKGLAMSLLNPSMFPAKSYGNLLTSPGGGLGTRANLIEDYLRAQASIYQQQEKELSAGIMFGLSKSRLAAPSASTDPPLSLPGGGYSFAAEARAEARTARTAAASALMMPQASVMAPPMMPPALAVSAMGAPSQNVCAKCNLSFRMTSDLVYHMRSQHRRETDPVRQKRQEKLRCPVCGENFRERHHLTRHMTSHDDRELEIHK